MKIRGATAEDANGIAEIYNHYIAESTATFEETPVAAHAMRDRLVKTAADKLPWIIVEENEKIIGYAYASKWNGRCAYRYSAEVTVYLAPNSIGNGVGTQLYHQLFAELRQRSYHVAIAGISLPNRASIALHEKFGMQRVALFSEVGYKFGRWIDVGYWQLKLDSR